MFHHGAQTVKEPSATLWYSPLPIGTFLAAKQRSSFCYGTHLPLGVRDSQRWSHGVKKPSTTLRYPESSMVQPPPIGTSLAIKQSKIASGHTRSHTHPWSQGGVMESRSQEAIYGTTPPPSSVPPCNSFVFHHGTHAPLVGAICNTHPYESWSQGVKKSSTVLWYNPPSPSVHAPRRFKSNWRFFSLRHIRPPLVDLGVAIQGVMESRSQEVI